MNMDIVRALHAAALKQAEEAEGVGTTNAWRQVAIECEQVMAEHTPVEQGGAA